MPAPPLARSAFVTLLVVVVMGVGLLSPPARCAEPPARARLLVLDVVPRDVPASEARALTELVSIALARDPRVDVISGADVRQLLELEVSRQSVGCDDNSCLSEIAAAMGARLVVLGELTHLGDVRLVTLRLHDTAAVRVLARAAFELRGGTPMAEAVGRAVPGLVEPVFAASTTGPDTLAWLLDVSGGVVLAGGLVALAIAGVGAAQFLEAEERQRALAAEPAAPREALADAYAAADAAGRGAGLAFWIGAPIALVGAAALATGIVLGAGESE